MKVITVFLMVVAVLVSTSTLAYGEAIDSEKLCEQIRSNKLDILTMGARGKSLNDAHFYILAKGGYMFKVPLANLRVDAAHKTTSITIDRDYIRADTLIGESQDLFTRTDRFFLISNQYQEAFLGRMEVAKTELTKQSIFRLYSLDGENISQNSISAVPIDVVASIGIDSTTANGLLKDDKQLFPKAIIGVHRKDEIKVGSSPSEKIMEFSSSTEIVTAFYHQENPKKEEAGYYFFLDTNGLVTVAQRLSVWTYSNDRFEVNLSSFVECYLKPTTILPQRGADSPTKTITGWILDHKWIVALGVGIFVVLGGLALCLYFTFFKKKNKAKRKGRKQKDSQTYESSNASTISRFHTTTFQASKASSVLQSVKSGLTSWLSGNKSKQAKTVAKAKKTKAKKPK